MAENQPGSAIVWKENKPGERPQYTVWSPPSYTDLKAETPYRAFESIVRTLHYEDYVEARSAGHLKTKPVTEKSHTRLSDYDPPIQGLFFAPVIPNTESDHNWYGNVSIEFDIQSLLENHSDLKFYFVENLQYRSVIAPRILISNKEHSLPPYDPTREGGPWYRDENGAHNFLDLGKTLEDFDQNKYPGDSYSRRYELEFILDVGNLPLRGDFETKPANHSDAKEEGYHKCKKYRSGPHHWQPCPSPWPIEKTKAKLQELDRMNDQ